MTILDLSEVSVQRSVTLSQHPGIRNSNDDLGGSTTTDTIMCPTRNYRVSTKYFSIGST